MKVLIIGSEGFIGSSLVRYFLSSTTEVLGCDISKKSGNGYTFFHLQNIKSDIENIFASSAIDYCINAAGNGNVNFSLTDPEKDFIANTQFTFQILDSLRIHMPLCKYLHISSAAVYGNPESLPVNENATINPISPYGWHKYMAEQICLEYFKLFGIKSAVIRPFSVYGPGLKKQLLWDIYLKSLLNDEKLELFGTGMETRDFVYIDDLLFAIEVILKNAPMEAEVYNIGSGNMTKIEDIARLLLNKIHYKKELFFNGILREGNPEKWQADISKINGLGFSPRISLEEGISKLAIWLNAISSDNNE